MKNLYKIQDKLYVIDNNEKITQNGIWARCSFTGDILKNRNGQHAYRVVFTDNDLLIKDGVQAIDDEFLSWFIKNPSCENVTVLQKGANTIIFPTPKNDIISDLIELERGVTITHDNKQETLEEAFEKWSETQLGYDKLDVLRFGAEWQAERMYSEEDMHKLMDEYQDYLVKTDEAVKTFKKWFEQFKKK